MTGERKPEMQALPADWFRPYTSPFETHPGGECAACGSIVTNPRAHELFHERLAAMAEALTAVAHVPPGQGKK